MHIRNARCSWNADHIDSSNRFHCTSSLCFSICVVRENWTPMFQNTKTKDVLLELIITCCCFWTLLVWIFTATHQTFLFLGSFCLWIKVSRIESAQLKKCLMIFYCFLPLSTASPASHFVLSVHCSAKDQGSPPGSSHDICTTADIKPRTIAMSTMTKEN